ncbi:MAG: beta-glucosidase [Actinomycetota bacterium]|nr:beta-glucosidase [Actinomycetota bacterium]
MSVDFPPGFVWGTSTAAHQTEGGNWNNDWWEFEHRPGSGCREVSGDAVDHFHRYPDDIRMLRELGFGAYRFSIEWSRIEPEDGEYSGAALEHYRRMLACCLEHEVMPVVTFHHFTTPRWLAARGGWTEPAIVDHFARFCERSVDALGDLIGMGCTINEPNAVSIMGYVLAEFPPGVRDFAGFGKVNEHMIAGHRKAYDVIKAGPGDFPLGLTLSMSDWWAPEGAEDRLARTRFGHEGQFCEAARGDDYFGVQAYTRIRLDESGMPAPPEPGVELLDMGYEYWPRGLEVALRYAAETAQVPLYVTENGIGTTDDEQRIRYTTDALEGVGRCLADGLDVRGYFHWSLMDNFEWAQGYLPQFGLVAVDRTTQRRSPKPSAAWLGGVARANKLTQP